MKRLFELQSRNEERAEVREPGSLVVRDEPFSGWIINSLQFIDEQYYTIDTIDDGSKFGIQEVAIIISCSEQVYEGRPSTRAHYVVTPRTIGWYVGHPKHLTVIVEPR